MTDDIITQATVPNEEQNQLALVDTLVGEGRKYSSVEELAKARIEADKFIEQLQFENKGMRDAIVELETKVNSSKTIEEVLAKLNNKPEGEATNNQGGLDPESVKGLVLETLQNETQAQQQASNRNLVNAEVLQKFNGDAAKAKEFIVNRLKEVQVDPTTFKALSEKSPAAALRLIELNTQTKGSVSPNSYSNVNTDGPPLNPNVRNQTYYSQLRKKMGNGKFFGDVKLQQQILRDVQAMGDAYYT